MCVILVALTRLDTVSDFEALGVLDVDAQTGRTLLWARIEYRSTCEYVRTPLLKLLRHLDSSIGSTESLGGRRRQRRGMRGGVAGGLKGTHYAHLCLQPSQSEQPEQLAGSGGRSRGEILRSSGKGSRRGRVVVSRDENGRRLDLAPSEGQALGQDRRGNGGDDLSPDEFSQAEGDAECPLDGRERVRLHPLSSELHDDHLRDERDNPDDAEDRVAEQSSEDVPLSVDLPRVDLVAQRHHHESIEDDRVVSGGQMRGGIGRGQVEEGKLRTPEEEEEEDDELVDGVAGDVLHHRSRDQRLRPQIGLPLEQCFRGHFSGERERGQRVHDQIHP
ncbi:hypothetical protein PMAYCL1PPCAC_15670, partial [Pristionchus mayeri]